MSEKIKEINLLIQQGEFKKSISLIDDILNKGTQDYRLFTMKGLALFSLGKYQNSIEYFTKSIEVKKDIFLIYNYRALANIVLAKNNFAIIDLKKTIELKPDYFEAYNTLGSVLLNNGKILEAIDSYVKCLNIKSNHKLALENLIVALTSENKVNYDNKIILANNEICKLKFEYSSSKFIDDKIISSTFNKSNIIIDKYLNPIEYSAHQIFRRNNIDLNCERHFKVFNKYETIPEFCFSCYKILIEPENVLDLIKLYILFDNIKLENNNIRKCMIELRPNVSGKYKGLIYCRSFEEAQLIWVKLSKILEANLNKKIKHEIKRGCTEFSEKYPEYKKVDGKTMNYNSNWKKNELSIDNNFPKIAKGNHKYKTLNGNSLNDMLIIRNWLFYAQKLKDDSHTKISDIRFYSKDIEDKISKKNYN